MHIGVYHAMTSLSQVPKRLLALVVSTRKRGHTPLSHRPSPSLPPELIYAIIDHLPSPNILWVTAHIFGAHEDTYQWIAILCNLCLVARAWYAVASARLYGTLITRSAERIHLLQRTLRDRPSLGSFTVSLHILNMSYDRENLQGVSAADELEGRVKDYGPSTLQSIRDILSICSNLEKLTMIHVGNAHLIFNTAATAQFTFRKLTIVYQCTFRNSGNPHIVPYVPSVKDLTLRRLSIAPPLLPPSYLTSDLHTLRLIFVTNNRFPIADAALSHLGTMSNLRKLVMAHVHNISYIGDYPIVPCPPCLDELAMIGAGEVGIFGNWVTRGVTPNADALSSLRHLTLGPVSYFDTFLQTWILPTNLESLTLIVRMTDSYDVTVQGIKNNITSFLSLPPNISIMSSNRWKRLELALTRMHIHDSQDPEIIAHVELLDAAIKSFEELLVRHRIRNVIKTDHDCELSHSRIPVVDVVTLH
ncbi:hypothetical protein K474DRAFT_1704314 [Panus rudis PR-1116 ss-1]|nr:hypothetical protein K474DRAFT_1704314 [Panus rudis PR-1116 ss-1]